MKPMIAGMVTGLVITCVILWGAPFIVGAILWVTIAAAGTVVANMSAEWHREDDQV